jgi:hypothetical protein
MIKLAEMDENVFFRSQMARDEAPIILINTFTIAPDDVDSFMEAWERDAAFMKSQSGYVSAACTLGLVPSHLSFASV